MSRYIDADAMIARAFQDSERMYLESVARHTPSIDIVRCKECRWGKPYSDKQLECDALGIGGLKFPDDYCSYGERREP